MSELSGEYKKTTILFPLMGPDVILGMKKVGFGKDWWNGFGGKKKPGEKYEQAAIRETDEESTLLVRSLVHVADLHFYFNHELGVVSKAYVSRDFTGTPTETDEMRPEVFAIDQLPYDTMWPADRFWIPAVLALPADAPPLGFIVNFDDDQNYRSIEEVDPILLESKF